MKIVTVRPVNGGGETRVLLSEEDEADDLGPWMKSGHMLMRIYCMPRASRAAIRLFRKDNDRDVFVYQGMMDVGLKDGMGDMVASLTGDLVHAGIAKDIPDDPSNRGTEFVCVNDVRVKMAVQAYFSFNRRTPLIPADASDDNDRVDDDPERRTHN